MTTRQYKQLILFKILDSLVSMTTLFLPTIGLSKYILNIYSEYEVSFTNYPHQCQTLPRTVLGNRYTYLADDKHLMELKCKTVLQERIFTFLEHLIISVTTSFF